MSWSARPWSTTPYCTPVGPWLDGPAPTLREVPTDKDGIIDLDALAEACDAGVALVSVMAVNNEIGTVQPLEAVATTVRARCAGAVLHTDAVQAVPWLDVASLSAPADLVAVSAHKFGGPKGVGALVVRQGTDVSPVVHGGGQERERRSGTHNVAGIVAMAAALAATVSERDRTVGRVAALRDRLGDGLLASVSGPLRPGDASRRWPATSTCALPEWRARPWWSCSTRPGWRFRPGRPARAAPSRRATC